jgi:hypothetical protein
MPEEGPAMLQEPMIRLLLAALGGITCCLGAIVPDTARAATATECTKVGLCYCLNTDFGPAIAEKVAYFRGLLAEQQVAGGNVGACKN